MSKLSVVLCLTLAALVELTGANYHHGGGHDGGKSKVYRKQDDKGNYHFGYNVVDPKGSSNYREESGDAWGNKVGSYGLKDKDGRVRIVHYVADKNGFRVKIDSNEPGVASVDSAHAKYNGPDYHGQVMQHHQHHKSSGPGYHGSHKDQPRTVYQEKPKYQKNNQDPYSADIPAPDDIIY